MTHGKTLLTVPAEIKSTYGFHFSDGENLVDSAYECLIKIISMMPDKKTGVLSGSLGVDPKKEKPLKMLPFDVWRNGLYVLSAMRDQWEGYFDVNVDELPDRGSVLLPTPLQAQCFAWENVRRISKLPKGVWAGGKSRTAVATYQTSTNILINYKSDKRELLSNIAYLLIAKDGSIVKTEEPEKNRYWDCNNSHTSHHFGGGALSMLADKKYLWLVECHDGQTRFAKVMFGIEMEAVKSLMYARDLPMTETGRKRPILHWVTAHTRRLEKGIEIDVRKHMRGITEFEMGDLHFKITSPVKANGVLKGK